MISQVMRTTTAIVIVMDGAVIVMTIADNVGIIMSVALHLGHHHIILNQGTVLVSLFTCYSSQSIYPILCLNAFHF